MSDPSNRVAGDDAIHSKSQPRLAYLLSIYPAISHTFFLNEITGLRRLGFTIDVVSINRPEWPGTASDPEAAALKETFYLKAMKPSHILWVLLKIPFTRPRVVLRGVRAALELDGWNLPATGYALFYLAEALLLGAWLRQHGHNHVHIHFGGPVATVGLLASIAWEIPYSITIHGPEEFYDVDKFYLRRKVEHAQFVLCISDYCRSQMMKVSDPAHWKKLHVVRLGVDLQAFVPALPRDRKGPTEIICVGRLVPAKGHLVLLRSVAQLVHGGLDLRLRLIGEGPERPSIEAFITEQKLEDSVILEGALNHQATRQKLMQADIFVLASFAEGLPIALMEAMAMEIPCVSTFVAGIPELIRDGREGLLVPPSSEHTLAVALQQLTCDLELRRRLAVAGRCRVCESYDLDRNVTLLADTLRALIATPRL